MPRISSHARAVVVVASLLALVLAGCRRETADTTADETTEPSPTAAVETAGEFQLVGRSEQAFLGVASGVDPSARPGRDRPETPEGFQKPPDDGVMRVILETFTDDLRDRCDADPGDRINVFWTRGTDFSPLLLRNPLETTLEARTVGVIGSIFRLPALELGEEGIGLGTASPSPAATPSVDERCVLVADQIGTERPQARATARPATPAPTPAPTEEPTATPPPATESPDPSPESTPEESP